MMEMYPTTFASLLVIVAKRNLFVSASISLIAQSPTSSHPKSNQLTATLTRDMNTAHCHLPHCCLKTLIIHASSNGTTAS